MLRYFLEAIRARLDKSQDSAISSQSATWIAGKQCLSSPASKAYWPEAESEIQNSED